VRLELRVDSLVKVIDTVSPDLLARWLLEQFASIEWTPATYVQAQAWPSFSHDNHAADWLCDSRYLTQFTEVRSPRDFLAQLTAALNTYEHDRTASPLPARQGTESRKAAEDYKGQTARQVNGPSTY
jgi:hypothetical protein